MPPNSLPQDAPKYILTKIAPNLFIFLPQTMIGGLQWSFMGRQCPPPLDEYPPPPRRIPSHAYAQKKCLLVCLE